MRSILRFTALLLLFGCASAPQPPTPSDCQTGTGDWAELVRGNAIFQGNEIKFGDLIELRRCLANEGQHPPFSILACSDSRVPPELVFKQNLGEVFLVRSAGNVTDDLGVASIEYALEHEYTKLLVILAHEKCGAVEAAMEGDTPESPNLAALVAKIRDSFVGPAWPRRTRAGSSAQSKTHATRSTI
jgi:carbonic anhydrase